MSVMQENHYYQQPAEERYDQQSIAAPEDYTHLESKFTFFPTFSAVDLLKSTSSSNISQSGSLRTIFNDSDVSEVDQRVEYTPQNAIFQRNDRKEIFKTTESNERRKFSRFRHKEYACDDCDRMFTLKHNLQQHFIQYHMGCRKLRKAQCAIKCEICSKVYSSASVLREHVDVVHQLVLRHECPQCHMKFGRINGLRRHVKMVHENVVRYCPYMEEGCTHAGYKCPKALAAHIRSVHTMERPFNCSYCPKKYMRRSDKKTHERKHQMRNEESSTPVEFTFTENSDGSSSFPKRGDREAKNERAVEEPRRTFRPELEAIPIKRRLPPRRLSKEAILARIK
ncbi:unnamed protein product [Caenorhabditis auriculariae]|uniref:C2H2-type domain-containing protein n=1 Tax=Caenorhabditis auriculariae TaxID=2777116 RepID=A0A8S1HV51_9PELO|nr:unnamed protein product [Caenorhabditis auriculariae]